MGKMLRLPQLVDMASQVSANNITFYYLIVCYFSVIKQRFAPFLDCFRDGLCREDELCAP